MSSPNERQRAASRAEARRRARMAARGEIDETDAPEEEAEPEQRQGGGFLRRLFPPAPPLPNRPDPLKGFDEAGPLRFIRVRIFLLRRNLLAWLPTGLAAGLAFYASITYTQDILGFVGTFGLFGAVIGAGWIGWQRPTLFGTAAAVVGYLLTISLVFWVYAQQGVTPETDPGGTTAVISSLTLQGLYLAGLGFLGGWYGGYLRRRNTQVQSELGRRRR